MNIDALNLTNSRQFEITQTNALGSQAEARKRGVERFIALNIQ